MTEVREAGQLEGAVVPAAAAAAVLATGALYLGCTALLGTPVAFPLDDSWIHQTFARHLAESLRLYYNPGEPSTASTAPMWTILLAAGYALPIDFRLWAYLLGLLCTGLAAVAAYQLTAHLFPGRQVLAAITAVGTALEWHLAWASMSGMETPLFIVLVLLLLNLAFVPRVSGLLLGAVGGVATLTRPEGAVLLALVLLARFGHTWVRAGAGARGWAPIYWVRHVLPATLMFGAVLAPYLWFNFTITGQPLPSTAAAKHAAYAVALSPAALGSFWLRVSMELFAGPLLLTIPGLLYGLWLAGRAIWGRSGSYRHLLPLSWLIALPTLYAIQLPATYHHGRYLLPVLPVLVIYGLWGTLRLLSDLPMRLLRRACGLLLSAFWLAMWINGGIVYSWDVKFINEQEVAVASWIAANTPIDSLIATHDVGAIGYFSGRRVLDTAGLVTPEIAPFVRDQAHILAYLREQRVDYLAIFPRWYPRIAADRHFRPVYTIKQAYAVEQGADNMVVYSSSW